MRSKIGISYDLTFDKSYTWNELLNDLGNNGNDVMYDLGVADSVTHYQDDFAVYSYPIRSEEVYVIGLADTSLINNLFELQNKKVGIIPYYAATTYLETNLVFKEFTIYQTLDDMVEGLLTGEIEYMALIKSEYEGLHFVNEYYEIIPKFTIKKEFDVAIIFPKDGENTEMLRGLYNKAIILSDTSDVSESYFEMQIDLNTVVRRQTFDTILITISAAIIFATAVIVTYLYKLRQTLYIDILTKSYNRRKLFTSTDISKYQYLYYFDFDHFKEVNDEYGHLIGDDVLCNATRIIMDQFDGNLYRLGGDEFILLSNQNISSDDFHQTTFEFTSSSLVINITFSIGKVSLNTYKEATLDDLIRYGDIAMYEAKRHGKNKMIEVTEEMVTKYQELEENLAARYTKRV